MKRLGQGRSGEVFLDRDSSGQTFVRKIFTRRGTSHLVLRVLTGSANPYTWSEAAIRSAYLRRLILSYLVRYWFGPKLRLPRTLGWRWNCELCTYELHTEYIKGTHAPLILDPRNRRTDPVRELVQKVMKPLQQRLIEAGFDGLVWQAGYGNPVACSNFMLDRSEGASLRWVWIDLESGVPALFALNPLTTIRFYLPKSLQYGRWLFDDVDVSRLKNYLSEYRDRIEEALGEAAFEDMKEKIAELDLQQVAWKSAPRREAGSDDEPSFAAGRQRAASTKRRSMRRRKRLRRRWLQRILRFGFSQRYRAQMGRQWIAWRIDAWTKRRFLSSESARQLRSGQRSRDVDSYVTDFSMHIALQFMLRLCRWFALPAASAAGLINPVAAGLFLLAGGSISRTLYTMIRSLQALAQRQSIPWVALMAGTVPVLGNLAYPAQLLYLSRRKGGELAQFVVCDTLASLGRAIPIWGGQDSLTEHSFSRLTKVVFGD